SRPSPVCIAAANSAFVGRRSPRGDSLRQGIQLAGKTLFIGLRVPAQTRQNIPALPFGEPECSRDRTLALFVERIATGLLVTASRTGTELLFDTATDLIVDVLPVLDR